MKTSITILAILQSCIQITCAITIDEIKPEPPPYLFPPPHVEFKGGDGSSTSNAVIIVGATSTKLGIDAEEHWIIEHRGFHRIQQQSLLEQNGRKYDVINYTVYTNSFSTTFDITDFFGKHDTGRWICTFEDGSSITNSFGIFDEKPWMPLVSNRTATVHFQKETAFNNGLVAIIPYKNEKINGISKVWRHSGFTTYTEYKDNKVNGFDFTWYTNGVPRMEWYNSNGCHRVKSTRYWHANGRLNSAFKIKNGVIQYEDGQKTWHANGAVESQYFKIPGSNNWLAAHYYPDGKPQCFEYMHDNDYGIGPKMEFYKNGMPEWFVQNENDTKYHGNAVINWHTNGTKRLECLLVTNKTTVIREWKPDGKLISEGFYKDDNPWNGTFYRSWGKYKGKILHFKDGKMIDP